MHTDAFIHRYFLHTEMPFYLSFQRSNPILCKGHFKIAILPQFLAIEPHFVRKGCRGHFKIAILPAIEPHFVRSSCREVIKSQFHLSFWRSNLISCETVAAEVIKSQFHRCFLTIEPHFVRKGCRGTLKIAISPQFLAIEPRFVRNGCASCRLVGTAPRLKRKIEKKERARGRERM